MLDAWSDTGGFWSGVAESWRPVATTVSTAAASFVAQSATASPAVAVEVGCAQVSVGVQSGTAASVLSASVSCPVVSAETQTVNLSLYSSDSYSPSTGTDDGHWFTSGSFNGQLYNSSGDVVFGNRSSDTLNAFCRFSSVIPNGAEIISAVPVFTCKDACSGSYDLNLYFAAADDQSAPTSASVANAIPVTSAVNWTGSTAWAANSTYQGPNVSSILQEVVDRDGFSSDNHVLLLIKENNSSAGSARYAYALEGDSTKKIKLLVEWRIGSSQVVTSTVSFASFVQAASALPQVTVQTWSVTLGISTNLASASLSAAAQASSAPASWSINAAEVTISTGTETTVSVSAVTASLVSQAASGLGVSTTQTDTAAIGSEAQTASSSVATLVSQPKIYATLATGGASGSAVCTTSVDATPATLAAQTATVDGLAATVGVSTVSAEAGSASASAYCASTSSSVVCALSAYGVTVSTENITVAHPGVARAAASGQSVTATCGCVSSLDAIDLALIVRAASGSTTVSAASGQVSISTALGQTGASSQSIATPAPAGASMATGGTVGSPLVTAPTTSLNVSIGACSPSATSAIAASCASAKLSAALLQAFISAGFYELWRYDSALVSTWSYCSPLQDKIFFDSSATESTMFNTLLSIQKTYDSNLAQYARFKTNVKVEKALV